MDFLGVGIPEVIAIIMLALIFIGPRDLPRLAARFGKFVRDLRMMSEGFMIEWRRELEAAIRYEDLKEIKDELQSTGQVLKEAGRDIRGSMRIEQKDLEPEVENSIRPPSASEKKAASEKTVSRSEAKAQNGVAAQPAKVDDTAEQDTSSEAALHPHGNGKVATAEAATLTAATAVGEPSEGTAVQDAPASEVVEPKTPTQSEAKAEIESTTPPVDPSADPPAEIEPSETPSPTPIEEPSNREQS